MWFQDEARVGQRGTLSRIWAKKGTRPRIIRQQQYNNAYIFGAVCPQRNEAASLVLPNANTESMKLHLDEISKNIKQGRHAIMIMDRASWHTTNSIPRYHNITLIHLPPYSPELNPVEQIWRSLRNDSLANRCFLGYNQIVHECCEAWNKFISMPGRIKELCSRKWAILS